MPSHQLDHPGPARALGLADARERALTGMFGQVWLEVRSSGAVAAVASTAAGYRARRYEAAGWGWE